MHCCYLIQEYVESYCNCENYQYCVDIIHYADFLGIRFLVHAFGMEYVRTDCGIRSISDRMTDQANVENFINRKLTNSLFWYWDDDTLNNLVNNPSFAQTFYFKTIYKYAPNQLKVWLQDIKDLKTIQLPVFTIKAYKVPECTIACEALVGQLIYDCDFKMSYTSAAENQPSTLTELNGRHNDGHVKTAWLTADNQFWIENYDMIHESLLSNESSVNVSTFVTISSIYIKVHGVENRYETQKQLHLQTIPRGVKSFKSRDFWKTVETNDCNDFDNDECDILSLAVLPPRIQVFELSGATEFNGTISFDQIPISTETIEFRGSQASKVSITKKIDTRSKLSSVSILSSNLKGYLDLQFFDCLRRNIRTTFTFNKQIQDFKVKNDREYWCKSIQE